MPEVFKMSELDSKGRASNWDGLPGWALLRAMTNKAAGSAIETFKVTPGNVELTVVFTINGVEVEIGEILRVWKGERDRLVRRDALRLIRERFGRVVDKVHRVERKFAEIIREEFPDLYREGDGERDALELDLPND